MRYARHAAMVLIAVAAIGVSSANASGDAANGKKWFGVFCAACHSTKAGVNMVGPSLAGVYGRKAGAAPNFNYSDALKNSGIVWNDESLEKWLANPQTDVPGNHMPFAGLPSAQKRADIIEYLKTLK